MAAATESEQQGIGRIRSAGTLCCRVARDVSGTDVRLWHLSAYADFGLLWSLMANVHGDGDGLGDADVPMLY
jgi:hypothetical protein